MHEKFLHRCLELAEEARGKTGINPMVGAVLVRDGKIIAKGFHEGFGKPHAELRLMQKPDLKIRSTDVLYVNLEPCCHVNKKTPPCAQMLIERGMKNVIIGMKDPNPAVNGQGMRLLQENGVNVSMCTGLVADCMRLNRGFVSLQTKSRPWITLKSAQTDDGRIANADGSPLRITSTEQDAWSHRFLRAKHDAILVGIGTVLKDDPKLTARFDGADPWRIILDATLQTPLDAKVVGSKTIIVAAPGLDGSAMREKGAMVIEIPEKKGIFDWSLLWKALTTPEGDFHGISSILVEGGSKTWKNFRKANITDEEVTLIGR